MKKYIFKHFIIIGVALRFEFDRLKNCILIFPIHTG